MRSKLLVTCIVTLTLGLAAGSAFSSNRFKGEDAVSIAVSPQTLVLSKDQSDVTVHTNLRYATVETTSVELNGIDAAATWADDCGDLVARFNEVEVKAIVAVPSTVLTLSGVADGAAFSASDTVQVMK